MKTTLLTWRTLIVLLLAILLLSAALTGTGFLKLGHAEAQSLTAVSHAQWAAISSADLLLVNIQSTVTLYLPAILR
jgi:hypothetical protein